MRILASDGASRREFALGAELGFGHLDPKRFTDLARGMGIPARDAALQVMGLITEAARVEKPDAGTPNQHLARKLRARISETFDASNPPSDPAPQCEPPEYRNPLTTATLR